MGGGASLSNVIEELPKLYPLEPRVREVHGVVKYNFSKTVTKVTSRYNASVGMHRLGGPVPNLKNSGRKMALQANVQHHGEKFSDLAALTSLTKQIESKKVSQSQKTPAVSLPW